MNAKSLVLVGTSGVLLLGGLVTLATPWGLVVLAPGIICLVVGIGLGRFRPWAWYGAIAILVPMNLVVGVAGLIVIGWSGGVSVLTLIMVLSASYVLWVLLSRGGRQRYLQLAEAMAFADENPDTLTGRAFGKRRGRLRSSRPKPDAGEEP